jgi:hypothetical protein
MGCRRSCLTFIRYCPDNYLMAAYIDFVLRSTVAFRGFLCFHINRGCRMNPGRTQDCESTASMFIGWSPCVAALAVHLNQVSEHGPSIFHMALADRRRRSRRLVHQASYHRHNGRIINGNCSSWLGSLWSVGKRNSNMDVWYCSNGDSCRICDDRDWLNCRSSAAAPCQKREDMNLANSLFDTDTQACWSTRR